MYQYKHYNLEVTQNTSFVLGVDGSVVYTARTEAQAQQWIDKEWKLSEKKIEVGELQAWYIGDDSWNIGGTGTVGKIKIHTTRRCVEDLSGSKKFRVVTKNEIKVSLNISWNVQITINETLIINGGPEQAIKSTIKSIEASSLWFYVRQQLEAEARKQGLSEWQIMDCYNSDPKTHCFNLYLLAKS